MLRDGLWSVKEAARFLDVSPASVWRFMSRGLLPWSKVGGSRRIPRKAIMDWVERSLVR